jgi:tetratricopeptide (TPR) repeat protein
MKKHLAILLFATFALGLCASAAFGQASGTVKGVCKDPQGNPLVDAVVVWTNQDNGQKYTLKTNKKGEYFSLGLTPGKYVVMLYKSADDAKSGAKELNKMSGFQVQLDENTLDFDLKKQTEDAAKGVGLTPEQLKQQQEQHEKQQKEVTTVKSLNDKLNAAKAAADAGDFDTAIAQLNEANQLDPTRDLIWFKLGDYYRLSAAKQTDPAEKQKRLDSAVESYQKAVDIKKAAPPSKDPASDAKNLAAYYNNLADAYYKAKKVDDAVKSYEMAAQVDPSSVAQSYFNIGAVLTNSGRADEANAAFDKCIAADPNRAEAYYQKGLNLLGKATLQGDKTIAPPGTAEAFQKYLELSPTGPNAQSAKDLLASLGASVETSYGKKKTPPKKTN